MRQRVRSRPGSWLAAAILLALGQLSCGTMFDVGLELKFGEGGSGTERGSSAPLPASAAMTNTLYLGSPPVLSFAGHPGPANLRLPSVGAEP